MNYSVGVILEDARAKLLAKKLEPQDIGTHLSTMLSTRSKKPSLEILQ